MLQYIIKTIVTALIVVLIAESGKRFTTIAAVIASLPLTSILAFIWLYVDTKNIEKVSELSKEIFWMVIPSLVFFIALPLLLKVMKFYPSLLLSALLTAVAYFAWFAAIRKLGLT